MKVPVINMNSCTEHWRPLLPNLQCVQVPLIDVPSVLNLYSFDVTSPRGGNFSKGYEVLAQDRTNNGRLREGNVKTITLVDKDVAKRARSKVAYVEYLACSTRNGCDKAKCDWKGRITVLCDNPLNLCNIEQCGNHDPDHVRKRPPRMAASVRKAISDRAASVTPSMMAVEFMNNAMRVGKTPNIPTNQVQPTSTRFVPNLEAIQNVRKYEKKLIHPRTTELEKVFSIMDIYEAQGTAISKQYGIKEAQDPQDQAVLLGIASTIMPELLSKYPDLLAIDSTGRRNALNFPNTVFMVRSDEPRGRVVATFVSDKETISVVDLMFKKFIQYSIKNGIELIPKWLTIDKWDPYLTAARKHLPNTQVVLCDWHEADALKEWFVKNLNDQWLRDRTFYQFRFVKRSRDQEEFDQRKTTLINPKELQDAIGIMNISTAEIISSYFRMHWFGDWVDTWPDYKRGECPMKTNMLLESYFKKDMILHYRGRYTKSLHSNLEKIGTSMTVDAGEMQRFWRGEGKPPTKSRLKREQEKIDKQGHLLYKENLVKEVDQNTWNVSRFNSTNVTVYHTAIELEDSDSVIDDDAIGDRDKENIEHDLTQINNSPDSKAAINLIDDHYFKKKVRPLRVTRRNEKFSCQCGFNVICGHDCQDIVAVRLFLNKPTTKSTFKLSKDRAESPAANAVSCNSLESYFRQKAARGFAENELKLPQKRGPKNKRKNRLMPGECIQIRDTALDKPYHKVQIVEIVGDSKIIVDVTFEDGSIEQRTLQLSEVIGYIDKPMKKKSKMKAVIPSQLANSSKDPYGNIVLLTMPYGGKKKLSNDAGELYLDCTCPVDTSLTLFQSIFISYPNIYEQATAIAETDSTSMTHRLLQVFDLMNKKKWVEAKFLWIQSLPSYADLVTIPGQVNLFGGLSDQFFEQFFADSLDKNLLVTKSTVISICDSKYCPETLRPIDYFDIILAKTDAPVLPNSTCFETCLWHWQEPHIVTCGSVFDTDSKSLKNVPATAFEIGERLLQSTNKTEHIYQCTGNVTSTRHIDRRLPLILAINVTGISVTNNGTHLQNMDLPEEISFPLGDNARRYRLSGVSFCNGSHHIADVRFENVENPGWYQYDGLKKTYRARAMHIGSVRPSLIQGYMMDYVVYVKL